MYIYQLTKICEIFCLSLFSFNLCVVFFPYMYLFFFGSWSCMVFLCWMWPSWPVGTVEKITSTPSKSSCQRKYWSNQYSPNPSLILTLIHASWYLWVLLYFIEFPHIRPYTLQTYIYVYIFFLNINRFKLKGSWSVESKDCIKRGSNWNYLIKPNLRKHYRYITQVYTPHLWDKL